MNHKAQQDLLRTAREQFETAVEFDRENRDEALDDFKFMAGEQWPQAVESARRTNGRPCLTINRLPQFVRQVTGDMKQNRPAIRVRPADDDADDETADVLTGLIRHIEQTSGATRHYTQAGSQSVTCGIGHFRIATRYIDEISDEQELAVEPIRDPLSVYWDPDASQETREDARFCFVTQWYSKDAFEAEWPDAVPTNWETANGDGWSGWIEGERVRVAEYWCKKKRKVWIAEDGQEMTGGEMLKVYKDIGGQVRRREVTEVVQYIMTGDALLEPPTTFPGKRIPIIPVIGEEIPVGDRTVRHGLIRFAKDAQRMYNYSRTAQVEAGALQPRAPYIATRRMIEGYESIWKSSNTANHPILPYNADPDAPGAMPQRIAPPMASQAWSQEIGLAAEDMKATTGIYDAGLGNRSNETSGVAIRQRQMESDTGTYTFIDNLARSIEYAGKLMVEIIPTIYDTDRVIRILGDDDTESTARINATIDPHGDERAYGFDTGKYDVVVDVGPAYQTRRQEAADSMQQFIQSMPQMGAYIADLYVQAQDWPDKDPIKDRIRKLMMQTNPGLLTQDEMPKDMQQQPQQEQQPDPAAMASAQKDMAMAGKYEADAAKARADAEQTQVETAQMMAQMQADMAGIRQLLSALTGPPPDLPPGMMPQQQLPPNPPTEAGFLMPEPGAQQEGF
jgi:hypothetical protein